MLFNLVFTNNTILSCFFHFFLIVDLYFLIPALITQIFNPIAGFTIPTETPNNEANPEIDTISDRTNKDKKLITVI